LSAKARAGQDVSRKVMKSCPASRFELANPLCLSAIPLGAVAAFQHGQLGLVVGKGSGYLWFIPAEGKVSLESTEISGTQYHDYTFLVNKMPRHPETWRRTLGWTCIVHPNIFETSKI